MHADRAGSWGFHASMRPRACMNACVCATPDLWIHARGCVPWPLTCPGPTVDLPACVRAAFASLRPAAWAIVSFLSSSCFCGCLGLRAATAAAVFSASVLFRPLVSPPPLPEGPGSLGLSILVLVDACPIDNRVAAPRMSWPLYSVADPSSLTMRWYSPRPLKGGVLPAMLLAVRGEDLKQYGGGSAAFGATCRGGAEHQG